MLCIFAEKFDVALKICVSLSNFKDSSGNKITMQNLEKHKPNLQKKYKPKGYIEIDFNGSTLVTWGQGHLVRLKNAKEYNSEYKLWRNIKLPFFPNYSTTKIEGYASTQLENVRQVFNKCNRIINATDYDREGDLIFSYIYEYLNCNKPYERVKLDSQTEEGFKKAFTNLVDIKKVKNIELAGRARSIADWVVGINLSVAKTLAENNLCTIGRVQTPTLNMVVEREDEIENFKVEKFYTVENEYEKDGIKFIGKIEEKFKNKQDAESVINNLKNGISNIVSIEKKETKINPPKLFNLTGLSMEANDKLSLSAKETLDIAQKLYENGYLTYPRTSSEYLTDDMKGQVDDILNKLTTLIPSISSCVNRKYTNRYYDTKKVESHYAIIPTNNIPDMSKLTDKEKGVYMLVAESVAMSVFDSAIVDKTDVRIKSGDYEFTVKGSIIREESFMKIQKGKKTKEKEVMLPNLKEGETLSNNAYIKEGKTTPPKRYTDKTLLQAMKSAGKKTTDETEYVTESGIGTEATRANIIEGLLKKEYIKRIGKQFIPTEIGRKLINTLDIDEVKSSSLTANWEHRLHLIERGEENYTEFIRSIEDKTGEWVSLMLKANKTDIKCPFCKEYLSENSSSYRCENCKFTVYKEIAGRSMKKEEIKKLCEEGETEKLTGFKSKKGTSFDTILEIDRSSYDETKQIVTKHSVAFKNSNNTEGKILKGTDIKCPFCNEEIKELESVYKCTSCDFFVLKVIAGRGMTKEEVKKLCEEGETEKLTGFLSKKGTSFDTILEIDKSSYNKRMKKVTKYPIVFKSEKKVENLLDDICPICKNKIYKSEKVYKCFKCGIFAYTNMSGHEVTIEEFKELLKNKKTENIKWDKKKNQPLIIKK